MVPMQVPSCLNTGSFGILHLTGGRDLREHLGGGHPRSVQRRCELAGGVLPAVGDCWERLGASLLHRISDSAATRLFQVTMFAVAILLHLQGVCLTGARLALLVLAGEAAVSGRANTGI